MPLCPAGAVSSSRKQGRRPEQAGAEEPAPPPQRHGPAPGCALCAAAGGFSGAGAGEGCGTPVLRPLPLQGSGAPSGGRLPASQPSSAPACRDPRAWCAEAPLVSVCPARFVRLRLGREATTALSRHCLWLALAQPDCSLSPGVEPAAGFHGEPHGRGRGCHLSGNIGHREDGRLATSLGIAAVSTLGTTQAGPPAVHH